MNRTSLKIGTLFGIPVRVHISWLLVFALVTVSLGSAYFPLTYPHWSPTLDWVLGAVTSLLFFASVLLHELAHSVVAQRRGLPVRDIQLFVFGGVSEITREPATPRTELFMAVVGPLTSLALGLGCTLLRPLGQALSQPLGAVLAYVGEINLALGFFNLIPGFPLDGGRVLRALLWWRSRDLMTSTRWASRVGQAVAYGFMLTGIWQAFSGGLLNGLWLVFIGWFLDNAAQTAYRQLAVQSLLAGHTVREIMARDCTAIRPEATLQEIVDNHILAQGRRCLPVVQGGTFLGLVTVHRIRGFPQQEWSNHTAREAMIPISDLRTIRASEGLVQALSEMAEDGVNQLPVLEDGQMVGLLTRENITTFLSLKAELRV